MFSRGALRSYHFSKESLVFLKESSFYGRTLMLEINMERFIPCSMWGINPEKSESYTGLGHSHTSHPTHGSSIKRK
jgi:hypothetical protein